ncbi:MAG: hypothetical protein Ct9H90mP27_5000 [Gammaproteobacteria bacterium]|nr:MAG: hypothetical protein Ct9H90mP27_5000 [Gammaproteobacteria bacterium]
MGFPDQIDSSFNHGAKRISEIITRCWVSIGELLLKGLKKGLSASSNEVSPGPSINDPKAEEKFKEG